MIPTIKANKAANSMNSTDCGSASPCKAPNVNKAVSATGPVCKYGDDTNRAAKSDGSAAA